MAVVVAAGGGGGYAVFASSNQAGTAILLILSAIFLLIGIQGTSLIRFTSGSNSVELERRRRIVEQALKEAVKEDDVERAGGIVEGVALASPGLPALRQAEVVLYMRRLELTIAEMGYHVARPGIDYGTDLRVLDTHSREIPVTVRYLDPEKIIQLDSVRGLPGAYSQRPLLIVGNVTFSRPARKYADSNVRLITWRDDSDNDKLSNALSDLFELLPEKPRPL